MPVLRYNPSTVKKHVPYRKTLIALDILLALFLFLGACCLTVVVSSATVDGYARALPSYEKTDISALLARSPEEWTEEELAVLERQTGILSPEALKRQAEEHGAASLAQFQDALFYEGLLTHDVIVPNLTYQDLLYDPAAQKKFSAPIVSLEPGDVIVSSCTHTVGWRHGHAALILSKGFMMQAVSLGNNSQILYLTDSTAGIPWFTSSANFIVLRLKGVSADDRKAIADLAQTRLSNVPYSLTVGIFSEKDQGEEPKGTQCSHLVWQAFKYFGYDIDANGGGLVTPRDIARSPLFDTVQIYGFDPYEGW